MISKNYKQNYKIPFSDLAPLYKETKSDIDQALKKIFNKGDFILGEEVSNFEKDFAQFCGTKFAVGVSSGTDALFLALESLGIGEGDEVIVPAFTYIATAFTVSYTGARPVFVDIDEATYNIDVNKIASAITKNTKAIIPVHLYGQLFDMEEISKIAKKYNLKIIEDAAQAHGAKYLGDSAFKGKRSGSVGDLGCFSFYPSKNLGAFGDGGMVTTSNEDLYKKLIFLRDYGRISKYEHTLVGYNARLDTVQAAILRIKLAKLDKWNNMRQKNAAYYNKLFKGSDVITPFVAPFAEHIYHVYAVRSKNRDVLIEKLKENGISALVHYPIPLHLQGAYKELGYKRNDFPVSEKVSSEIISLPMYQHMKKEQIERVVKTIKES